MLVKFKNAGGGDVYINPKNVQGVHKPFGDKTHIIMTGVVFKVEPNADEVVNDLNAADKYDETLERLQSCLSQYSDGAAAEKPHS